MMNKTGTFLAIMELTFYLERLTIKQTKHKLFLYDRESALLGEYIAA